MTTRTKTTTYAIAAVDQVGTYPELPNLNTAFEEAFHRVASYGETIALLRVEGPDDDLTFTPLCVVSPPNAEEAAD